MTRCGSVRREDAANADVPLITGSRRSGALCARTEMSNYMFWRGDARSAFTYESLEDLLNRNGFQQVLKCEFGKTYDKYPEIVDLDSREYESLICEAIR